MPSSTTLSVLLDTLHRAGIRLSVHEDRLRAEGPPGALTPELQIELRERKQELLALLSSTEAAPAPALSSSLDLTPAPLSHAQERVWLVQALEPESTAYNLVPVVRLEGALDVERLERALLAVIERHEPLRTRIASAQGRAEQRVVPVPATLLHVEDLSHRNEAERDAAAAAIVRREQARPFDLEAELPVRAVLIRRDPRHHELVCAFHHIAVDGTSLVLFYRDLLDLYAGRTPAPLPVRYTDYARWERTLWQGERLAGELGFWTTKLAGAPPALELPTDRPRPPVQTFTGGLAQRVLDVEASARLSELARSEGASLFMVLLAAFSAALHRASGQRDLVVGTPVDGRTRPELAELTGMFVNQLALRVQVPRGASFRELLAQARSAAREAFAHQELPFSLLVEALKPPRDRSRTPVFQVMLNVLPPARGNVAGDADGLRFAAPDERELQALFDGQAKFDVSLYGREQDGRVVLSLVYNRDLFAAERMELLLERVERLLVEGARQPDLAVNTLLAVPPAPAPWAWAEPADASDTVIDRLRAVASARGDALAVVDTNAETSWSELLRDAERIARLLASAEGLTPGGAVGIFVEHRASAAAALLGTLRSAHPYLPLDPAYPEARLRFMLEDSGAAAVLCEPGLRARAEAIFGGEVRVISLDLAPPEGASLPSAPSPDDPAYLLYTSGSTGTPKAVVQTHRNLVRQAERYGRALALGPSDRVTLTASISFDASLMDLFGGLLSGAAVVFLDLRTVDLSALPAVLEKCRSTTFHTTPTVFRALARAAVEASFSEIRAVVLGGEPVRPEDVAYFDDRFPARAELINLYGASEHSFALGCRLDRALHRSSMEIPLGWPVGEVEAVLLAEDGTPDPLRGELALRGDASARGYWNRPELTARAFLPDPERPGATLYRTGDVVRRRDDGALVFLHRADQQLKIRGHRVEPGEVEAALAAHPLIAEVAVHAPLGTDGDATLVACIALRGGAQASTAELQGWCREQLPAFAVPSGWVFVEALPRTPSGKVDRRQLPTTSATPGQEIIEPRSAEESILRELWAEVLGRGEQELGVTDDFFVLGGHSLSATQVVARIRDLFEVELPLRYFFDHPTISETAQWVRSQDAAHSPLPPITRRDEETAPLSFSQERIWLFQELDPGATTYHITPVLRISGPLRVERLAEALHRLLERHATLRTVLEDGGEGVRQRVRPVPGGVLRVEDLSQMAAAERDGLLREMLRREHGRPFDLRREIPFRALLVRREEELHDLVITFHHLAADGTSVGLFIRDLLSFYAERPLPALPVTYADVATWEREQWSGDRLEGEIGFWREHLEGAPRVLELPTDRPRPASPTYTGALLDRVLCGAEREALLALAHQEKASLFMALLAAFAAALFRQSGQRDLIVGTATSGRSRSEVQELMGMFVNQLPLRMQVERGTSFRELLQAARRSALSGFAHQELPFARLVEALDPPRDRSRTPLFQAMLNLLPPEREDAPHEAVGIRISAPPSDELRSILDQQSKFDLTLYAAERGGALRLALVYNRDLFDAERMNALLEEVEQILRSGITAPDRPIEERWTTAEVRRLEGADVRVPDAAEREGSVVERISRIARRNREQPALSAPDALGSERSYAALTAEMERIACLVAGTDTSAEPPVGVLIPHGGDAVAAVLGVLRSGRPYLPLDPDYPAPRLAYMAEDSALELILTTPALAERARAVLGPTGRVLLLDQAPPPDVALPRPPRPEAVAYRLYTSGSTGRPKAVVQSHRNLLHQAERYAHALSLGPGDRLAWMASLSFDASLMDIFGGLCAGATLCPIDPRSTDLAQFPALLEAQGIGVLHLTPTVFRTLVRIAPQARYPSVRAVVLGGEPVRAEDIRLFDEHFPAHAELLNLYGASEHSFALGWRAPRTHRSLEVPIGYPVGDVEVVLLGPDGRPDPVRGEIALRSAQGALGYWNDAERTKRSYVPDPLHPGRMLYRTGDIARRRPDGALVFLHRADLQLKVRGHRIEPAEVEVVLQGHPAVAEAAVYGPTDAQGEPLLAAAVAVREGARISERELAEWCAARLPTYMVPTAWMVLARLPRTPSGKIDRRSLPQPAEGAGAAHPHAAPRSAEEQMIAELWAEVLGRGEQELGVTDDFFVLGGHSLSATQVVARIRDLFEVELPLRYFFDHPTISETAQWVRSQDAAHSPLPPITRRDEETAPLSFSQERMWFLQALSPESTAYHMGTASLVEGDLDVDRLREAVETVIRRQASLRTRISSDRGRPFQRVDPNVTYELQVVDISAAPRDGQLERARELAVAMVNRPFDLARGPLFRILVAHLSEQKHLIAVGMHHIISDLWSFGILAREIASAYERPGDGVRDELPVGYDDYAAWQRAWLEGGPLEEQLRYWTARLRGLQTLELPTDHPRPRFYEFEGGILRVPLSDQLYQQIQRLSAEQHATPFMVLLSAFNALLHAHSRQTDLAVGVPIANRTRTITEGMIGTFVNTLVHRNDLSGDPSVRELIARVRSTALEAYAHQDVPFELLVKELDPARDTSRSPLFQVLFNVGNAPLGGTAIPSLKSTPVPLNRGTAQFDLTMNVNATGAALSYNTSLYTRATAERWLAHYVEILERAVANPEMRLSELAAVSSPERECLLERWNRTERAYPREANIAALLEASAERTPHRIAIESPTGSYSYAELLGSAQRITAALLEMGVRPGDRVGILMERSREMLAALIGILGAGAAYVPVDPAYPESRVAYMLENSEAAALVTHRGLERRYGLSVPTLDLGRGELPPPVPFLRTRPEQTAYVIYTSGSTGKPKGVEVPHGAMVNFLHSMAAEPGLGVNDAVLALTTISFDIAVLELYLPLLVGARIVMLAEAEATDGRRLAARLEQHGVTLMQATPATFKLLLASGWPGKPDLRVLCGGEPLPRALADDLGQRVAELWNMYGPTETTVWSTVQRIEKGEPILVGRPIANTSLYVLDEAQRLLPIGTPGELYIGGHGVAIGYMNRPDLTAERFIESPFHPGERLYRTGDQVRFHPDGRLEHLGRLDHQVKVRGFRIELGEVEAVLRAHPAVRDVVVVAHEDRLVAYPVFHAAEPPIAELRRWMAERLPAYMMPSVFVPLEALPLTPNGKVDRKQLPEPSEAAREPVGTRQPKHPNELLIAEVWATLLEVEQVGVDDNFFELGGHSLLAMQAVALIEERTGGHRLDPRSLFFQSLGELARSIPLATQISA